MKLSRIPGVLRRYGTAFDEIPLPVQILGFALAAVGLAALYLQANACMTLSQTSVGIHEEQSIVVYNPQTQREDFIREVTFNEIKQKIGFIVPTPTRPELTALSAQIFKGFSSIYSHYLDELQRTTRRADLGASAQGISVQDQGMVAGYHAYTIAGDDPNALNAWLRGNHFPTTHAKRLYLDEYLQKRYYLTAFLFTPTAVNSTISPGFTPLTSGSNSPLIRKIVTGDYIDKSPTIDLTFKTLNAYYPYEEPTDTVTYADRLTTIYAVLPARVEAYDEKNDRLILQPKYSLAIGPDLLAAYHIPSPPGAVLSIFKDTRRLWVGIHDLIFGNNGNFSAMAGSVPATAFFASAGALLVLLGLTYAFTTLKWPRRRMLSESASTDSSEPDQKGMP